MATPMNTNFSQYTDQPFDVPEETFDDDEMVYGKDIYVISGNEDQTTNDDEINLDDIMQTVNKNNISFIEEDDKKYLEEQKRKKEKDKLIREQRQSEIYKDIAKEEQINREQKEKEEFEEFLLEQEQQKQSSLFSKFGAWNKKKGDSNKQNEKNKEIKQTENKPTKNEEISSEESETKTTPNNESLKTKEESQTENVKVEESLTTELEKSKTKDANNTEKVSKEIPKKSFFSKFKKDNAKKEEHTNEVTQEPIKEEPQKFTSEEEEWKYLATHDGLTQLKNLKAYEFDTKNMEAKNIAIIFLDVNNLKYVNDNFGHESGNKLLLATSTAINQVFPDNGYRIGGDEFLIIYQKPKAKDDKIREDIEKKIKEFHKIIKNIAKNDEEGIPYAVSVGFDIGTHKKSIDDIKNEADKKMYEIKKKYKQEHPDFDVRHEFKKDKKEKKEEQPKEYDTMLSKEQQELKGVVKENHRPALEETTEKIMMEIQRRNQEILAILIASPTFDHLFIIQEVGTFIGLVNEMDSLIDYSYLYVVYEGGPQYYGTDEYYNEVTHIFEAIANGLKSRNMLTNKDIQKIKGINIFKEIYIE